MPTTKRQIYYAKSKHLLPLDFPASLEIRNDCLGMIPLRSLCHYWVGVLCVCSSFLLSIFPPAPRCKILTFSSCGLLLRRSAGGLKNVTSVLNHAPTIGVGHRCILGIPAGFFYIISQSSAWLFCSCPHGGDDKRAGCLAFATACHVISKLVNSFPFARRSFCSGLRPDARMNITAGY